jgi:hypothetical protein
MSRPDYAEWLHAEHARVEEVAQHLREQLAGLPNGPLARWVERTQKLFEQFRTHMLKHFGLEEEDGFLEPVIRLRPNSSREVDRLQHQHVEISKLLDDIHTQLTGINPEDRLVVRDCSSRIANLLTFIKEHEDEENLILLLVYNEDIGTTE